MRKIIALCMVSILAVSMIAGCGSVSTDGADETTSSSAIEETESVEEETTEAESEDESGEETTTELTNEESVANKSVISLYLPDNEADGLAVKETEVDTEDVSNVIELLIEEGVIAEGTEVLSFGITTDGTIAEIDFSEEFYTLTLGTAGETLMLESIANTLIECYDVEKVRLLVGSENYSSGHIEYGDDDYISFADDLAE